MSKNERFERGKYPVRRRGAENDFSTLKAPILGHYGEEDRTIAANNAQALQARLEEVSPDHEVYLYPFAGHAFARKGGSKYPPPPLNSPGTALWPFWKNIWGEGGCVNA